MSSDEGAGWHVPARRIIVGLGNPGRAHRGTRHNAGFMVADRLAAQQGVRFRRCGLLQIAVFESQGIRTSVVKPTTYMNRSGDRLVPWFLLQGRPLEDMLVVQDDLDLPVGRLRLKRSGGSGGHRGVQDLIDRLGGEGFPRLKIGIGRPPPGIDPTEYVLGRPEPDQCGPLADAVREGCRACLVWAGEGIEQAMNLYNAPARPDDPDDPDDPAGPDERAQV